MRDLARFVALICVAAFAMSAMGQSVDQYDRLLLPLTTGQVPGAFGSTWDTDVALTNLSDTPLTVLGFQQRGGCPILCGPLPPIPARATIFPDVIAPACPEVRGVLLWVERGRVGDLDVALRTHDLSRQNQTWGTTIPVISVDELFARRFGLVDVPMDPQFRSTLRIYDFNAATPGTIRVRIYAVDPAHAGARDNGADALLFEMTPLFSVPAGAGQKTVCPGYVEIPLSGKPELSSAQRIRVEIEPLDGLKEYWGFVSVTHNETQHVTIVTPK